MSAPHTFLLTEREQAEAHRLFRLKRRRPRAGGEPAGGWPIKSEP